MAEAYLSLMAGSGDSNKKTESIPRATEILSTNKMLHFFHAILFVNQMQLKTLLTVTVHSKQWNNIHLFVHNAKNT